jgi:hypothetical protein
VELRADGVEPREPRARDDLFGGVRDLLRSDVAVLASGERIDPDALTLAELHAVRAIATHEGWLAEPAIEVTCRNCNEALRVRPCAEMQLGPFLDAELDDEHLDALLPVDVDHLVSLGPIRLKDISAGDALPLHRALAKKRLRMTADVVTAMGIVAIGGERDALTLARALDDADDEGFAAVTGLFLAAHYPPRLFALVTCSKCGARNDIDAPYVREFEATPTAASGTADGFPSLDAFDAMAQRIAGSLPARGEVTLIVDDGVPACDDGGEPLLGSYVPSPHAGGEVTVYYRTFRSMWEDDGPYDVEAELAETIEHELEHHASSSTGHDSMDDEERDEIADEALRVIGRKAVARAGARAFLADIGEFWRRTWLIWFVALIAAAAALLASR